MNQKGFSKVLVILLIIVGAVVIISFALPNTGEAPVTSETNETSKEVDTTTVIPKVPSKTTTVQSTKTEPVKTTTVQPTKNQIQFTFPKGGEKLEAGKIYNIAWSNYSGTESLTIVLQTTNIDGKVSVKDLAVDLPAASVGSHPWTVSYEGQYNRYKVGIFPSSKRSTAVYSKEFYIVLPWGSQSTETNASEAAPPYATPSTGQVPLNVGFSIPEIPGFNYESAGIAYVINYGDGTTPEGFPKNPPFTKSHTYNTSGTYTAVITKLTQCSYECLGPSEVVSKLTIKVNPRY